MVRNSLLRLSSGLFLCSAIVAAVTAQPGKGSPSTVISATAPLAGAPAVVTAIQEEAASPPAQEHAAPVADFWSLLFVFLLASFIGMGVIRRVSRLLHTPLMSLTNAISAIAVVGSIIVTGADYPQEIRIMGAIALFASVTNIVSGFLITDRMLKMFKTTKPGGGA
jgi:NAD(P) transhydrogenase subunit alpha